MKTVQDNSRASSRAKRKKTKFILSGSIVIGLILVGFVLNLIFSSGEKDVASGKSNQASSEHNKKEKSTAKNSNKESTDNSSALVISESITTIEPETPIQSGQKHASSYDSNSQDWQDMLKEISSATGIDQRNMTVWFLGSDRGNPGGSVGTVSSNEKGSQKYRVYIKWDDSSNKYVTSKVEPAS